MTLVESINPVDALLGMRSLDIDTTGELGIRGRIKVGLKWSLTYIPY